MKLGIRNNLVTQCNANVTAVPVVKWLTAFTPGSPRNDFTGEVGGSFIPANAITITSIGVYIPSGGSATHTLSLWDGLTTLLVKSATINFTGKSGFNFVNITPAVLVSGREYRLSLSIVNTGDVWCDNNLSLTTTAVASVGNSTYSTAIGVYPITPAGAQQFVGLDFTWV